MRKALLLLAAMTCLAALPLFAGVASADTTLDTYSGWNGSDYIWPFGEFDTATYGQSFTAPVADNSLDSFSFWLKTNTGDGDVDFAAYVMAWGGDRATGPVLWDSTASPSKLAYPTDTWTEFTYDTGGVTLTGGGQYVVFLSASDYFNGTGGTAQMAVRRSGAYGDGAFQFHNNGSDFSKLTGEAWDSWFPEYDSAFKMEFSDGNGCPSSPELSTWALLACSGLAGVVLRRRRRA